MCDVCACVSGELVCDLSKSHENAEILTATFELHSHGGGEGRSGMPMTGHVFVMATSSVLW